jgi:site-specific recombinase XerD
LSDVAVDWIDSQKGVMGDNTLEIYSIYFEHLAPHFPSLNEVTTTLCKEYMTARLQEVLAPTVRHELSALRVLVTWASEKGLIGDAPFIPSVPKRVLGTPYKKKRRCKPDQHPVEDIEKFLAALPVHTSKLGFVRPRFVLQYEMCLRPSLVDRLEFPKHWTKGSDYLDLDASIMKGRRPSRKRLTARAKACLEEACPAKPGPIFGSHDYRETVIKAAEVLPTEKRERFTTAHLRSAGLSHFLEAGASLSAAQHLADHLHATTTDRYLRTSEAALTKELERQGRL